MKQPKFYIGQKVIILPCAWEINISNCSIGKVGIIIQCHEEVLNGYSNSYDFTLICNVCAKKYGFVKDKFVHTWWAREQDLRACITKGQQLYLWEIIST